jgi:RNA polymerase sigma-70 factor (ECF subfamily)
VTDFLAEGFEEHRAHLHVVSHRMLGSRSDADDAVQEAWLRVSRADATEVENLGGWLTTIVARADIGRRWELRTRPRVVFDFGISVERIVSIRLRADPGTLAQLDLTL